MFCFFPALDSCLSQLQSVKSTVGKDFVLCYPHNNESMFAKNKRLFLYIMSRSNERITGTINYTDTAINNIPFYIDTGSYFMTGISNMMELDRIDTNENKAVFIHCSDSVSVVLLSEDDMTSDACIAFPIDILDTSYVVSSYENSLTNDSVVAPNMSSTFAVIGTEDNTMVNVLPTAPLKYFNNKPFDSINVTLNKGETRFFKVSLDSLYDLTGTRVNSNKPIAVISSHERISVPRKKGNRNTLLEQSFPVSIIGDSYVYTPCHTNFSKDTTFARIIPVFDSTIVDLGDTVIILNKFQLYEKLYDTAFAVRASKPVICAQYGDAGVNAQKDTGDSFLMILPSVNQFMNSYSFEMPQFRNFKINWINVEIEKPHIGSIYIDGIQADTSGYKRIANTNLYWRRYNLNNGYHRIYADTAFGIIVYGFGLADAYGYVPAFKAERQLETIMDKNPPQVQVTGECSKTLNITENNEYDSGIDTVYILYNDNVKITNYQTVKCAKEKSMFFELVNNDSDGKVIYLVKDCAGNFVKVSISLKGFTVAANSDSFSNSVHINQLMGDSLNIFNYGLYEQNINIYFEKNINFSIPQSFNIPIISPGSAVDVPVYFYSTTLDTLSDTLVVFDECNRKKYFPITITVEPNQYDGISNCNIPIRLKTVSSEGTIVLNVSPNPFSSSFNIEFTNSTSSAVSIDLYDILGNKIYSKSLCFLESGAQKENIEPDVVLSPGLYTVAVRCGGEVKYLKVIKE